MSVAAFIDVQPTEQDLATELAITLAEFCVAENEALFLMADRITALEIGISLIGASESRTVEDSEHRVPTIVLLPFIPRANSLDNEVLRYSADLNVGGDLEDLFDLGVFARGGPRRIRFRPQPSIRV